MLISWRSIFFSSYVLIPQHGRIRTFRNELHFATLSIVTEKLGETEISDSYRLEVEFGRNKSCYNINILFLVITEIKTKLYPHPLTKQGCDARTQKRAHGHNKENSKKREAAGLRKANPAL